MLPLSINRLNAISPYKVWEEEDKYIFKTDYDVKIGISFDKDDTIFTSTSAYWFNIVNLNGINSPNDGKIMPTIWTIVEEFFRENQAVLLYLCDTADEQQASRARLFKRWFILYKYRKDFIFKQTEIVDEGITNYVSIIIECSNSQAKEIAEEFTEQTNLLKEKP